MAGGAAGGFAGRWLGSRLGGELYDMMGGDHMYDDVVLPPEEVSDAMGGYYGR